MSTSIISCVFKYDHVNLDLPLKCTWLVQSAVFIDDKNNVYKIYAEEYNYLLKFANLNGASYLSLYNVAFCMFIQLPGTVWIKYYFPVYYNGWLNTHSIYNVCKGEYHSILHLVKRIQRFFHRIIQQRKQERYLALSMGFHTRLGNNSMIKLLSDDLILKIIKC